MYTDIISCQFLHKNKAATVKELLSKALKEKSCFIFTYLPSCGYNKRPEKYSFF